MTTPTDDETPARALVGGAVSYDDALAMLRRHRAEVEELRQYAPMCLVCGARKPCMTEADLKPGDPGTPCTFDPTPKEAAAEILRLRAEVERLTRERDEARHDEAYARAQWEAAADFGSQEYVRAESAESALAVAQKRVGELHEALTDAVAIIRKYVPADALGMNSQGGGDGWNDQSWPILDEHLHYMDAALANTPGDKQVKDGD